MGFKEDAITVNVLNALADVNNVDYYLRAHPSMLQMLRGYKVTFSDSLVKALEVVASEGYTTQDFHQTNYALSDGHIKLRNSAGDLGCLVCVFDKTVDFNKKLDYRNKDLYYIVCLPVENTDSQPVPNRDDIQPDNSVLLGLVHSAVASGLVPREIRQDIGSTAHLSFYRKGVEVARITTEKIGEATSYKFSPVRVR